MSECHTCMPVAVLVHEYVRGCYLSPRLIIKITSTITLLLNYSPSPPPSSPSPSYPPAPNIHMQHHPNICHRRPTPILTLYQSPSHTPLPPHPYSPLHPNTPLLYFAHSDIFGVWRIAVDATCGDAYRDVEMVHAVLHIVWAHVTRDASAKARAYCRRHNLF